MFTCLKGLQIRSDFTADLADRRRSKTKGHLRHATACAYYQKDMRSHSQTDGHTPRLGPYLQVDDTPVLCALLLEARASRLQVNGSTAPTQNRQL